MWARNQIAGDLSGSVLEVPRGGAPMNQRKARRIVKAWAVRVRHHGWPAPGFIGIYGEPGAPRPPEHQAGLTTALWATRRAARAALVAHTGYYGWRGDHGLHGRVVRVLVTVREI